MNTTTVNKEKVFHPLHECNDGIINTMDGAFSLINPTPESIHIKTIAGALSKQVRFTGLISELYNNAQHSVFVMLLAPPELKKAALLHDAHEAYTGDISKPLKVLLGESITKIQKGLDLAICAKYGLDPFAFTQVKKYDMQATELEQKAFQMGEKKMWTEMWDEAFDIQHCFWDHQYAEFRFALEFTKLFGEEAVS